MLVAKSETTLTDVEDDNIAIESKTPTKENYVNGCSENDEKSSLIDSWMKERDLAHLKEHLMKHDMYSLDKLHQLALADNFEYEVERILENNTDSANTDKMNLMHGCNALLSNSLGKTKDFLSKLNQLCQETTGINDSESKNNQEWVLILIDCDDIGLLINNKDISMKQAQNSINLLNANICRIIEQDKGNDMFGYHLGGDLFALFVCDNCDKMIMTQKSIKIVELLLNVMRKKDESSFTISVGMSAQQRTMNGKSDINTIKGEWVLRAHTNLLRAKENGKNCYFNKENDIDSSKDNKELMSLTAKMNQLYDDLYIDKCEILIDQVLKTFDQETIVNQTVTTKNAKSMRSVYLTKAWIVFSRKNHVGNKVYRVNTAKKWIKLALQTFILGKMSIECYYYHKLLQKEIEKGLQSKKQREKETETQSDNWNNHSEKYDLTLLTRKRKADDILPSLAKNSSVYYGKQAYEHVKDMSDACVPRIVIGFGNHVGKLGEKYYEYQQKLYQQVIELDEDCCHCLCRINLAYTLWNMKKYATTLQFVENSIVSFPNNTWLLWSAAARYRDTCKKYIDKKLNDVNSNDDNGFIVQLNKDERLTKALEYGRKMIESANVEGQWKSSWMYLFYGSLLYVWSKDFDKNKEQQVTALKMYEKGMKLDQQFGYDIINNWIRDLDKFEHELVNIIVDYWYTPDRSMQKNILDCVDLIETYFNQNESKMNRAKRLANIVPHGFIRKFSVNKDRRRKPRCYYVVVKKPGIYDKMRYTGGEVAHLRTVIASWKEDVGGVFVANNNLPKENSTSSTTKFCGAYAAKLAYFFAFLKQYEDFIINELGLTIDLIKKMRNVMIKLLIHYAFKLQKKEHKNFEEMIKDSTVMQNMVAESNIYGMMKLEELGAICDKIEKHVNLEDEEVVANMSKIINPYVVAKNNRY